ncbi:MAG: hypothetical protein QNK42_15345, partial [Pseudodonghicola sp.]|nr:hypothetical protein [Pseudodonghicola sp.]
FFTCNGALDAQLEVADLSVQHGFERSIEILNIRGDILLSACGNLRRNPPRPSEYLTLPYCGTKS